MMVLYELQQKVYQNKISRGFNVQDVGKEIILLTEEVGELNEAYIKNDEMEILDAIADISVYCLGMCEMFNFNSNLILNFKVEKPKHVNVQSLLPFVTMEIGNLAKLYKLSNKKNVTEIDKQNLFKECIGNVLGYCYWLFNYLDKNMITEIGNVIINNTSREHSGHFSNTL
ncbi:MAG: hypothetical protein ABIF40_04090 [archaeon]